MVVRAWAYSKSTPSIKSVNSLTPANHSRILRQIHSFSILNSRSVAEFQTAMVGAVDSSLDKMGLWSSSHPFPGCIDLIRTQAFGYTLVCPELRIIEVFAGLE